MKLSTLQMIAIVCILAVGFVSVAPFFLQEANAGADRIYWEAYKLYSFHTGEHIGWYVVHDEVIHTDHYNYYHYPGSEVTAWEHRKAWPDGHGNPEIDVYVLGKIWI